MGVSQGQLIQIIGTQSQQLQTVLNVYYYRWFAVIGDSTLGYLTALANDFETRVRDVIRTIQNAGLSWTGLSVKNLSNNVDILERAYDPALLGTRGAAGATTGPTFLTNTFRLQRADLTTRNGYKRFAGVDEADVANSVSVLPAALVTNIIAALLADLQVGAVPTAGHVIVKRPIVPPVGTAYMFSDIQDVDFRGLGSQNTRKIGRGI